MSCWVSSLMSMNGGTWQTLERPVHGGMGDNASLLCGAPRLELTGTSLGANGECWPKSGSHGMPSTLLVCSSLVWGHAICKLHAGMPHHLHFFKMWCPQQQKTCFTKRAATTQKNANQVLEIASWPIKKCTS